VKKGNFRHDLYYRLNVIPIELPPLRSRREDIPRLTNYFMKKISYRINKRPVSISEVDMEKINGYSWPGNVRELENFIELAINKEKLPLELIRATEPTEMVEMALSSLVSLEELEKDHIKRVLNNEAFNITNAAKTLGVGRNTLYRKMEKHRIPMNK